MEKIHDITAGIRKIAGLNFPHPNKPEEYNVAAAEVLNNLADRIDAAYAREITEISKGAWAKPGPQKKNEVTVEIRSMDIGLYHRTVEFEGGPFWVFNLMAAVEQNLKTVSAWLAAEGRTEGEKR